MANIPNDVGRAAVTRDRDATGRARNARPRDALGRPLPYGSADVARQPEGVVRSPAETINEAQRLLDEGLPFHAHEVFEDAWKSSSGADRAVWKGLAQLAVGLTHLARGNRSGASALLRRGRSAIAAAAEAAPDGIDTAGIDTAGIDTAGIILWADRLTARLDQPDDAAAAILPALQLRSGGGTISDPDPRVH